MTFTADEWSIARLQSKKRSARKSWVITHYRASVSTQLILRRAKKHFTAAKLQRHSLVVIQIFWQC